MKAGLLKIASSILLLAFMASCAGNRKYASDDTNRSTRIANLKRAMQLPWVDDGRCAVQEASNEWPVVVEKCFYALDPQKIRFEDPAGKCAVASVDAAIVASVGKCLLAAMPVPLAAAPLAPLVALAPAAGPVIVVAGVIVVGVIAAIVIVEALDYYEERRARPETETSREAIRPVPQAVPAPTQSPDDEPGAERKPAPRQQLDRHDPVPIPDLSKEDSPKDDSPKAYVVRLQAQGGGIEESVVLASPAPILAAAGVAGLETLKGKLSPKELRLRADLFPRAERFIRNAPAGGGVGPPGKSFALPRSDIRVDVEILRGVNFQK